MSRRILIVTEIFHPESTMLNDFVSELVGRGFVVEILTRHPSYPYGKVFDGYVNDDYHIEHWNGIKIHRFKVIEGYKESKLKKIFNYWTFVRIGNKIAKKIGGDFDHILVYQTGPLTLALPAITIAKKFGKPVTVWTCDIWPDVVYGYGFPKIFPLPQFLDLIIRKVYKNATNITISSKRFADTIREYVRDVEIHYTPNWMVEEPQEESDILFSKDVVNFVFAGNISISQNLENVILGWHKAKLQGAILHIIGDGTKLESLKSLIHIKKIEHVKLYGRRPSNEIQSVLKQGDVLILPLLPTGGIDKTEPFKLQSYLSAGKAIFGVIGGSGKDIIEEHNLGLCAKPLDVDDISRGFLRMVDFSEKYSLVIAENARKLLTERFNRERTINKIVSLID